MMQFLVLFGPSPDLHDCPTESLYQTQSCLLKLCNLQHHIPQTEYTELITDQVQFMQWFRVSLPNSVGTSDK